MDRKSGQSPITEYSFSFVPEKVLLRNENRAAPHEISLPFS